MSRILDGQPGNAGRNCFAYVLVDAVGINRESAFEIGVDGNVDSVRDLANVRDGQFQRDVIIRQAKRPGHSGARGGQSGEAKALEQSRAAAIPGIRENEASRLVKGPEGGALL
jgi:hypothetical protein